MLTRFTGYAYPWDYAGDPGAAARAARLGLDVVAVAACYHVVRAVTPLHPRHRIHQAERAACYVPLRESAWAGQRLVPSAPAWDPSGRSFGEARRQLSEQGLEVAAWVVLTHNSTLGARHPELVVRNAFGDGYPYALCPSNDDVRLYCATLVREVATSGPLAGLVVEACGPMGLEHGGHHDRVEFAGWDAPRRALLSICFCAACRSRYAAAGLDADSLAATVRAEVDGERAGGSVEAHLGEAAGAVAAVRGALTAELRALVVASAREAAPGLRVTIHGSSDPWATGSFGTLHPAVGEGVDAVVANCWDPAAGAGRIAGLRALAPATTRVGAYLRLDRDWSPGEPSERMLREYGRAGASELHLYHLGLLGAAGLERMRTVVASARG